VTARQALAGAGYAASGLLGGTVALVAAGRGRGSRLVVDAAGRAQATRSGVAPEEK